jgi:hypothetical protein
MKFRTHQRWNQLKIMNILGSINKTMQIPNITKIITAGNIMLLKYQI